MNWTVELTDPARKQLARLDKAVAVRVIAGLRKLWGRGWGGELQGYL